ncbi:Serine/threonine protein phosphatase 1 (modular protein) [Acidobacteriia bacterium SbA2]|nr:Serine/threonine protein phosphatase 1 (modular protein) [Acidobacteriia bacterium SbA2]
MAQEPTANQSQEKRVRLIRPSVVLLCGPAACGKSTFAQRHFRPTQIVSSDWARGRVCDDERDQRFNTQAFALVRYLTELRMGLNRLSVVDSTALTPSHRREFLELAKRFQVPCVIFLFDVPLEKCIERDRQRERSVGSPVIERHYLAFGQTKTDIRQEGFDQIVELGDSDLDKVQIEVVFRPISQPSPAQGRRPQTESRPASRPWQPRPPKPQAGHEAGPPPPAQAPPPASSPAKPEPEASSVPPKPPSTPGPERAQPAPAAGTSGPAGTPSTTSNTANKTPTGSKTASQS